jgi:uncharacterized integral membrane protein
VVICPHQATFSGAVAGEKEDFCKGSLARTIFTLFIVLLYFIFACIVLSKTHKKIVSFIVVTLLLLVHYVVPYVHFGGPLSR